ncbi:MULTISPECIES: hypothetical protein [unclassified Microbacterium]|uniref:hypothetical protein n=1 Tax=unclassified Microbacterium TaxID=2609290 RepID=UPI00214B4D1F|nr:MULTISPECIES: hypothetical protein [unclassified Microbacterium]MCR2783120.1 hypothetical protein [Microbacterium sp. zg.B96]WIM15997.1 hypothetical protein QNO11_15950 [Microbacterium sp. zg-B96]
MTEYFHDEIAQVEAARERLSVLQDDLARIRMRAAALAHDTDWQSTGAQAFRDAVATWQQGIALLDWPIERLRAGLLRTRGMLDSLSGGDP